MKHWHQCVKYTLPQCSFQFIFLLVSYVYKKKSRQKERGYRRRPKPVRWLRLTFCHLKPGAGGSPSNTLYKYQLRFLPSQATLHKWCHDKAQRNSCCCSEHSGSSRRSKARSSGCILASQELGLSWEQTRGDPARGLGRGPAVLNFLSQMRNLLFCSKIKYFLGEGPAKAKFLFPEQQITIFT